MIIFKALAKQLFGAKYEQIFKSLTACLILFFAIYAAEFKVSISPSVLFLTSTVLSAGIMWQSLNSGQTADGMSGLFLLPFKDRQIIFSMALAFSCHTLITKTFPVLALFFAANEWNAVQIAASLLVSCNGCLASAAWYTLLKTKRVVPVLLWCAGILFFIFFVQDPAVFVLFTLISLLLSIWSLFFADPYMFYHPMSAKLLAKHPKGRGSVSLYLLRYLATNKNYLLNTAALCVAAVFLPSILGWFKGFNVMPMGFAVLNLNTPICILMSCDPHLEQALKVLPGQVRRFSTRYCLFIFSINMAISSIYLVSWQVQYGNVSYILILITVLLALLSAILSVFLEWKHPVRGWKTESDLWQHPRKYLVPMTIMLIAALISAVIS